MTFSNVMMVGAGAVGGFFGAHLARTHGNISFLLRPATLAAVRERGLTIRSPSGALTVRPLAASDPAALPAPDLIILANKVYDLDAVLRQISPVLTDRTVILTLQNGVDVEDRIIRWLDRDCVVGGVAFIYAKIAEPGVIEHYKRGGVTVGELMGNKSPRLLAIADLFTQAGISCRISEDIRRAKWEKMCWNCVFNPLTVVINDRVANAIDHSEMLGVIRSVVGEVVAVAASHKIDLGEDMADKVVQWTQEIRDIHTSMYDDWKAGRPTEIDSLNGYIVERGKALGIPAPVNEALAALVKVITEPAKSGPGVLTIDGAVVQPIVLDRRALATLPESQQVEDLGAILPGRRGRAIRVRGLLELPAIRAEADHVTFHAQDRRFAASLTLEQAREHGVLVYEMDGAPLSPEKGGPFRLLAPGLGDLCANVKSVNRLELTRGPGKDTRPSQKQ